MFASHCRDGLTAGMVELDKRLGPFRVEAFGELCHPRDALIGPKGRFVRHADAAFFDGTDLDDDEPESSSRPGSVVIEGRLANETVRVEDAAIHRRDDEAVLHEDASDVEWGESLFEVHVLSFPGVAHLWRI